MSDGRYSGSTPTFGKTSTDVGMAEIRAELRGQGKDIATIIGKIDTMTESVTAMTVQVSHLVTKEACADGRAALAEALKNRIDNERDAAGVGLPVKDLVKHYMLSKSGKPSSQPAPYYAASPSPKESESSGEAKKARDWRIWVGTISGVIAILASIYSGSVFIDRTVQRQDRTDQILLQLQQTLAKNSVHPDKQAPVKTN